MYLLLQEWQLQPVKTSAVFHWNGQLFIKFSVRLSELAEPIRELSKDKVPFNWGPEHQEAFKQIRKRDC